METMKRLVVLLVAREGLTASEFRAAMEPHAERFAKSCAAIGATSRVAYQVQPDPMTAAAGDRVVVAVNGVLEATLPAEGDVGRLIGLVEHFGLRTAEALDTAQTAVLVGDAHVLLPDLGSVMVLLATRRLTTLDAAGFNDYWLKQHGSLALRLMSESDKALQGYTQLHADQALSLQASGIAGLGQHHYDGVLQCTVEDIPTFLRIHANQEFDAIIYADEEHFVDRGSDFRGAFLDLV
jgi:hypothetical protein